MFIAIWALILIIVASGVIGAMMYRNNVKEYSPYAEKMDILWDKMEAKIEELKDKIENKDSK